MTVLNSQALSLILPVLIGGYFLLNVLFWIQEKTRWHSIPAVGCNDLWSFIRTARRFDTLAKEMVDYGCEKYPNGIFRIPRSVLNGWQIVVTKREYLEELRNAPEELASLDDNVDEEFGVKYLLTPSLLSNPYHVHILRSQLSNSKTLGAVFNEVHDEVKLAFDDTFANIDDWVSIPAYATFLQMIARTTTRLLVGEPLCHNPEFLGNVLGCVVHVIHGNQTLGVFPSFLKPLAAKYLTNVPQSIEATSKFLQPIIHERREQLATFEDDTADKPLNFLSWLLDEAKGEEQTLRALTLRILFVSFASIHSTSMTFTHAVYNLAVYPEYKTPLREEIESVIEKEGWSRESINKMAKLDSFLKESLRLNKTHAGKNSFIAVIGISSHADMTVSLHRRIRASEFVFADGTRIPKGTIITAVELPVHPDPSIAKQFNGFRYINEKGQHTNQFVSTSLDYLAFGHGKKVCPGRFSANDSLKTMLAYFILNYDVRLKDESVSRPPNVYNGVACLPNPVAEVMIRRRKQPSI